MPTYQYICKNCGHELEELQSITEPPLVTCPSCKSDSLARILGSGGGVIFKGTGFYLTDYVKNEGKKSPPASKKDDKKPDSGPTPPSSESKSPSSTPPDTKKE